MREEEWMFWKASIFQFLLFLLSCLIKWKYPSFTFRSKSHTNCKGSMAQGMCRACGKFKRRQKFVLKLCKSCSETTSSNCEITLCANWLWSDVQNCCLAICAHLLCSSSCKEGKQARKEEKIIELVCKNFSYSFREYLGAGYQWPTKQTTWCQPTKLSHTERHKRWITLTSLPVCFQTDSLLMLWITTHCNNNEALPVGSVKHTDFISESKLSVSARHFIHKCQLCLWSVNVIKKAQIELCMCLLT